MNETQKIEMNKQYRTRDGRKVRVLCVDVAALRGIVALITSSDGVESVIEYYQNGSYYGDQEESVVDLIEYNPAQDLKVDDKIWVRDNEGESWKPRHFSSYSNGRLFCWQDGGTSYTKTVETMWVYWKKD